MQDLEEQALEALRVLATKLQKGERIVVTTTERCDCGDYKVPDKRCMACKGSGFIISCQTLHPN